MERLFYHQVRYYSAGYYLGSQLERMLETNGGKHALIQSIRFVCPHCGEAWGAKKYDPHPAYNRGKLQWKAQMRPCTICSSNPDETPGSLVEPRDLLPEFIDLLPRDLISYEALTRLNTWNLDKIMEPLDEPDSAFSL